MSNGPWWATFFEGPALEAWRRAHTPEECRAQAADIARCLGLSPGVRVLDVPCGNGRLALELGAKGVRVSGIDASCPFLAEGQVRARERGIELDLRVGDMRELPWTSEFEAAFCAGNSFGYFDEDGNEAFLQAVAKALRPRGRFLLELPLVAELVLAAQVLRNWHLLGERLLLSDARFDQDSRRLETTYTFVDLAVAGGALTTRVASYRIYAQAEVELLLRKAGFVGIEWLGEGKDGPFEPGSGECHALATLG